MENIFSKEPLATNNLPQATIIIDTREKNSLIPTNLIHKGANYKFEKLDIADYLIDNVAIERKTFQDFLSSMTSGRLMKQLIELKKYETAFLILEGFYYNYNDYNIHENAIRGMLLKIATSFKIPIIYTQNEEDTAKMLISLARQKGKTRTEPSTRPTKTFQTLNEQKQFILEGFPGIGPKKAKELIKEFKTLKAIFNDGAKIKNILDPNTLIKLNQILED
jgi:Fanconi anemia group M protein